MRIRQTGGGWNEANFSSHRLQYENGISRTAAGILLVGELNHVRPIAGRAAVTGRVIDEFERAVADVVVDRLGDAHADETQAPLVGEFGDLVGRIHRVVAADIAEVADVVGLEDFDEAVEVLLLRFAEFVPARADRTGRRRHPQQSNFFGRLRGQVEQFLLEHAFDPVPARVNRPDVRKAASRLDQAAQAVVDHRGRPARLGHHHIFRLSQPTNSDGKFGGKAKILKFRGKPTSYSSLARS